MITYMTRPGHCPTCTCQSEPPDAWFLATFRRTDNPADLIPTYEVFRSYAGWYLAKSRVGRQYTQNGLTRWLRTQGIQVNTMGGRGNHLVGYQIR